MAAIKKQHKRTAIGCWTCRRRKIKCDAHRPVCLKCQKSKIKCDGYDVKLNWSSILTVGANGEYLELKGEGEVPNYENGNGSVFQRSNIELCLWWLYDYYHEIDRDLDRIDRGSVESGPFRVLLYSNNTAMIRKPTLSKSSSIEDSAVLKDAIERPNYLSPIKTNTAPVNKLDIFNDIYLIQEFIQKEPILPNIVIINDTRLALGDFLLSSENDNTMKTQLNLIYLLSMIIIELMHEKPTKEIVAKIWNYYHKVNHFMEKNNDLLISLINKETNESISQKVFDKFMLILIFKIVINTNLGICQNWVFFNDSQIVIRRSFEKLASFQYFKFFQSTHQLINGSQFILSQKYQRFYQDLSDNYNLLKEFSFKPISSNNPKKSKNKKADTQTRKAHDYESRRTLSTNKDFKIRISVYETPDDQIIRVPKYIMDDDEGKDEPSPPSFTIHFGNEDDRRNSMDDGFSSKPHEYRRSSSFAQVIESEESSDDGDNDNFEEESHYEDLFPEFNEINDKETSEFGISSKLIYLYYELCHLINHKRIFDKMGKISRNWMRICCDFEDLLIRRIPKVLKNKKDSKTDAQKDEIFHDFLIFCFFKYVKNFPLKRLSYHLKKFQTDDLNIGILKLVSHNILRDVQSGGKESPDDLPIYGNNFKAKEFLRSMNEEELKMFNKWDTTNREFFII
jgi:hypothetical protein